MSVPPQNSSRDAEGSAHADDDTAWKPRVEQLHAVAVHVWSAAAANLAAMQRDEYSSGDDCSNAHRGQGDPRSSQPRRWIGDGLRSEHEFSRCRRAGDRRELE